MSDQWFDGYAGQTTDELLALESDFRIDSLVLAFEQGIQEKAARKPLTKEERYVLAVEGVEREVNNGGYNQFFLNDSREFVDVVEDALVAIGCPKTASITKDAIQALGIRGEVTAEKAEAVALADDEAVRAALDACDGRYYDNDEPIAERLFEWIKDNRGSVRLGAGES
jgi:hypothetical protein